CEALPPTPPPAAKAGASIRAPASTAQAPSKPVRVVRVLYIVNPSPGWLPPPSISNVRWRWAFLAESGEKPRKNAGIAGTIAGSTHGFPVRLRVKKISRGRRRSVPFSAPEMTRNFHNETVRHRDKSGCAISLLLSWPANAGHPGCLVGTIFVGLR